MKGKERKLEGSARRQGIFKLVNPLQRAFAAGGVQRPAPVLPRLRPIEACAREELVEAIASAGKWLLDLENDAGYWVAEFEADTTVESYFILCRTFMGQHDDPRIEKYACTIRRCMLPEGGWAVYANGPPELSVSVLSYFALKVAGVPAEAEDMRRARKVIRDLGGVTAANTYTKFYLSFFGQYDWSHVPAVPPELILLPSKGPVSIYSISSWARAIFVPMSILYALKPVCQIPPQCGVDELFANGKDNTDMSLPRPERALSWKTVFILTDKAFKVAEKFPIGLARRAAIKRAERWMLARISRRLQQNTLGPRDISLSYSHDQLRLNRRLRFRNPQQHSRINAAAAQTIQTFASLLLFICLSLRRRYSQQPNN